MSASVLNKKKRANSYVCACVSLSHPCLSFTCLLHSEESFFCLVHVLASEESISVDCLSFTCLRHKSNICLLHVIASSNVFVASRGCRLALLSFICSSLSLYLSHPSLSLRNGCAQSYFAMDVLISVVCPHCRLFKA